MLNIRTVLITWLALGALLAASGCASGGYQAGYYYPPGPGYVYSQPYHSSDIPPSFYNNDPTLRKWYTAPYWNPEAP